MTTPSPASGLDLDTGPQIVAGHRSEVGREADDGSSGHVKAPPAQAVVGPKRYAGTLDTATPVRDVPSRPPQAREVTAATLAATAASSPRRRSAHVGGRDEPRRATPRGLRADGRPSAGQPGT